MQTISRRHLLQTTAASVLLPALLRGEGSPPLASGKAEHCIFLWLGGGMSHIDTFDPKRRGDKKKIAGTYYDSIETAMPGVRVTEHLPRVAKLIERMTIVRTVSHNTFDEHATATQFVH